MNSYPHHRGVIVPLVTPVNANAELDEVSALRLVEHLASNACGMLALGTTGEVASLSASLRRRYVEIAARVAGGRTPVFAGIVHNCLSDSIAAGNDYLKLGADAVVGMLPNYYKLSPDEMLAYFTALAAEIHGPLLIYNMPATTGMSIPVEVIETLSHVPNIIGLKDSENTAGRAELIAQRLGGRGDFSLFMGVAANSVAALKLGFDGMVPSSGNLYPERWSALYQAALAGDWTKAENLQQQLDALNTIFQRNRILGPSLAALKAGLGVRSLCGPFMVPPLQMLPEPEQSAVREEIIRLG